MSVSLQRYLFGRQSIKTPNVFIGGVGASSVTSPADFIAKTTGTVTTANIFNFVIGADNNVSFYIDADYQLFGNDFYPDSNITYYVDLAKLTGINTQTFRSTPNMKIFKALNSGFLFYGGSGSNFRDSKLNYVNTDTLTYLHGRDFQSNNTCKYFRHKGLLTTYTDAYIWGGCSGSKRIYVPNCTTYRTTNDGNSPFTGIGTGTKIYVPVSMLTVNAGSPHIALQYAVTNSSAVLVGVVNQTAPSAISNLSASSIATTSFNADFTPPSSTNTLDYYQVWIERQDLDYWHKDRVIQRNSPYQEIYASGTSITGLPSGVLHKVKIVAGDIYGNESAFSNEITLTTL